MNTRHSCNITCVCALIALVLATVIAGCASRMPPPSPVPSPAAMPALLSPPAPSPADMPALPPTPPPVPAAIPLNEAILKAANDLFSKVPLPSAELGVAGKHGVVIDPLVDGVTGVQSNVTHSIEARIVELVRTTYPQFEIQPFSAASVAQSPLVLIGTFAGVNTQGQVIVPPEAFRIC
jgi:hypothetical protein